MYPGPPSAPAQRPPSAGTAETLILVGLILQGIIFLVYIAGFVGALVAGAAAAFYGIPGLYALAVGFYAIGMLIALFILYGTYRYYYGRTRSGNYEGARHWGLWLTILGFIFGYVIVGILYLVAYIKLGDAINEQRMMGPGMGAVGYPAAPLYGAPAPAMSPPLPGTAVSPPAPPSAVPPPPVASPGAPACPRCGQPGSWIPQYGRFYCYRDQQYL